MPLRLWKAWRRRRVLRRARLLAADWQAALRAVPAAARLSPDEQARLRELVILFLHEKSIAGTRGLVVTDAMRRIIAVQACLLILNLGIDWYRGWHTVLVYPDQFTTGEQWEDEHGVVHVDEAPRAGESWPGGPVVLSWADVLEGHAGTEEGYNLIVHEFAHKLDDLNGSDDGMPLLHEGMDAARWQRDFRAAYEGFCRDADRGRDLIVDDYAADSPAEFFAVISEAFFEKPRELRQRYAAVYAQLQAFYRQDPAAAAIACS
jgi:hypothetical protein